MNKIEPKVSSIMSKEVISITKDAKFSELKTIFDKYNIHHLPVLEGDKLIGMVSTNDLIRFCFFDNLNYARADIEQLMDQTLKIEDFMMPDPIALPHNASIKEAAFIFRQGEFHSLPVVDEENRVMGIVTTKDMMGYLLRVIVGINEVVAKV